MGRLPESEERKKQMLIHLIQTTEELITEIGLEAITIRAISAKAKCNSASLYKYFRDLDELLLYACIKKFKAYIEALAASADLRNIKDLRTIYLRTWELFCLQAFSTPEATYQLFFSKHSPGLEHIVNSYFNLFPEELASTPVHLMTMVSGVNLKKRNWKVLFPLLHNSLSNAKIVLINDLTIAYFQMLLNEKILHKKSGDVEALTKKMLETCAYLIDKADN